MVISDEPAARDIVAARTGTRSGICDTLTSAEASAAPAASDGAQVILSCVYVYIGAHVFKYGDDLLVTLRGGEIESGQGDVSSKCSAGEPEGCVGPVALYRGAGRFDILLIACYFIYDDPSGFLFSSIDIPKALSTSMVRST